MESECQASDSLGTVQLTPPVAFVYRYLMAYFVVAVGEEIVFRREIIETIIDGIERCVLTLVSG